MKNRLCKTSWSTYEETFAILPIDHKQSIFKISFAGGYNRENICRIKVKFSYQITIIQLFLSGINKFAKSEAFFNWISRPR